MTRHLLTQGIMGTVSPAPDGVTSAARAVEARLVELGSVVVAFSGGVDSSVVAALAARALGDRAVAVTASSAALADGELDAAARVAAAVGIRHEVVDTAELDRAAYRRNDRYRCYHCKTELYERLGALARTRGGRAATVVSGANVDDLGDWRPGLVAAAEHGVVHPLVDAGVGKAGVRALATAFGVPSADKPASPCLASRLPYGTPVTLDALSRVDRAEAALRARGYRELRVRYLGDTGRVEVGADELDRVADPGERAAVIEAVRAAGFVDVEVGDVPLRSGSLNSGLLPLHPVARR